MTASDLADTIAQLYNVLREVGVHKPDHQAAMQRARRQLVELHRLPDEGLVAAVEPEWASNPPPWTRGEKETK